MKVNSKNTFKYQVIALLGKGLITFLETIISLFIKRNIVFKTSDFLWTKEIESNYSTIYSEFISVSKTNKLADIYEISEEQHHVVDKNYWQFLPLYIYGIPISENISLCPETVKIIESIPGKTTVFFSAIKPGTRIKKHRGAYKGYLRYHLGIKIPVPNTSCGLKIVDEIYNWENGKSLIFDDTYLHEAWNNSDEERVVLYVDFIRPMPCFLMKISERLTYLIGKSPFVQNSIAKLKAKEFDKNVSHLLG